MFVTLVCCLKPSWQIVIGLDVDLMPDGTKPLPDEPMLTYRYGTIWYYLPGHNELR